MNDFWLFIENHIEVITGISSIFIAILALGYSIWQAKLMIKHNKLSLRPLITFLTGAIGGDHYSIYMENGGPGAAIVKRINLVDLDTNNSYDFSLERLKDVLIQDEKIKKLKFNLHVISLTESSSLFSTKKVLIFSINFKDVDKSNIANNIKLLRQFLEKIDIIIHYESLYGEKFVANLHII